MSLDVEPLVATLGASRANSSAATMSMMTFAVFHEDEQIGTWVEERTHVLADKYPSRIVIFDAAHDQDDQRVTPGAARGEWVDIGASGVSGDELARALAILEVPSAPVLVLWAGNSLSNDERALALARTATATICSSSLIHSDTQGLRDLTTFVESHPEIAIHDVAYLRLGSWQETIAEFFDDPVHAKDLSCIESVDLTAGSDAEMYYLLGWLASRLAWTPQEPGRLSSPRGPVAWTMHREGPPRRFSRIELQTATGRYGAFVPPEDDATICLEMQSAGNTIQRCSPLLTVDLASLVERAILERERDNVFVESMTMARHILDRQNV